MGGGIRKIWTYSREHLKQIARQKQQAEEGVFVDSRGRWLTAKAVHRIYSTNGFNFWDAGLSHWRTRPCQFLDGRTVRAKLTRLRLRPTRCKAGSGRASAGYA
jgi:hypothetical protein